MSEVAGDDDTVSDSSNPPSPATSPEILEHESDEEAGPSTSSRPPRQRTLPARFCQDSSESDNDGAVCMVRDSNEPEGLSAKTIFWIDCDKNVDAGLILSVHLETMQLSLGFCAYSAPFNLQVLYIHIIHFFH